MDKPEIIMLIGPPGSGKSTWIKNYLATQPAMQYSIISADDFIMKWAAQDGLGNDYDAAFRHYPLEKVVSALYGKASWCNTNQYSVIWDQTNLDKASRAGKLACFPGYHRKAVVFEISEETLKQRRNSPERLASNKVIPDEVLAGMALKFQAPDLEEFDEIMKVTV